MNWRIFTAIRQAVWIESLIVWSKRFRSRTPSSKIFNEPPQSQAFTEKEITDQTSKTKGTNKLINKRKGDPTKSQSMTSPRQMLLLLCKELLIGSMKTWKSWVFMMIFWAIQFLLNIPKPLRTRNVPQFNYQAWCKWMITNEIKTPSHHNAFINSLLKNMEPDNKLRMIISHD